MLTSLKSAHPEVTNSQKVLSSNCSVFQKCSPESVQVPKVYSELLPQKNAFPKLLKPSKSVHQSERCSPKSVYPPKTAFLKVLKCSRFKKWSPQSAQPSEKCSPRRACSPKSAHLKVLTLQTNDHPIVLTSCISGGEQ